jgi:hypothetical protein
LTALQFTAEADRNLTGLEQDKGMAKRFKAVRKAFGYLETNPRHKALNTHPFPSLQGANGEKAFAAYAENHTPAACRIFWHCGPGRDHRDCHHPPFIDGGNREDAERIRSWLA